MKLIEKSSNKTPKNKTAKEFPDGTFLISKDDHLFIAQQGYWVLISDLEAWDHTFKYHVLAGDIVTIDEIYYTRV